MSRKTVGFESLPTEILLNILPLLPDLESLDSIIHASPNTCRFFNRYGPEIADRVLDSEYTHPHIRTAIRTIAHIRSNRFPVHTVAELRRRVTCEAVQHNDGAYAYRSCPEAFAPTRFPSDAGPGLIRGVLATARRMRVLTGGCIEFYLAKYRGLRPVVPVDQEYMLDTVRALRVRADDGPTVPVERKDVGEARWLEEQLVYRAFWRVQLVRDLVRGLRGGEVTGWEEGEVSELERMEVADVYDFKAAHEEVQGRWGYGSFGCIQGEMVEHSLILSVLDFLETQRPSFPTGQACSRTIREPQDRDYRALRGDWSHAGEMWSDMLYVVFQDEFEEPKERSFAPFRRLGFAIWTSERLRGYGFDSNDGNGSRILVTWLSVLRPEEIATLERTERRTMGQQELEELEGMLSAKLSLKEADNGLATENS